MRRGGACRSYLVGFGAALALTIAAFGIVAAEALGRQETLLAVAVLAVAQIVVHLRYFLHLGLSRSKQEDLQLILFAAILIGLMVCGTLWVMSDLSDRMTP